MARIESAILDPILVLALGVAGGYSAASPWLGGITGLLVALGGGLLRDLFFGLTPWVFAHPYYAVLALFAGMGGSLLHRLPLKGPLLPLAILSLDFAASLAFGMAGSQRVFQHTQDLSSASLGGLLTAMGGGFIAAFSYRLLRPAQPKETHG